MMKLYDTIKYMQIGNFNSEELYQTPSLSFDKKDR